MSKGELRPATKVLVIFVAVILGLMEGLIIDFPVVVSIVGLICGLIIAFSTHDFSKPV